MNIYEFAKTLDGREYGKEITKEEEAQAKELGFVVVFGYSDDNAEFRGAIDDEVGCYDGGKIFVNKDGIDVNGRLIEALWYDDEYDFAWSYETDIPHATFEILEGGEPYCRGIVFDINKLTELPTSEHKELISL